MVKGEAGRRLCREPRELSRGSGGALVKRLIGEGPCDEDLIAKSIDGMDAKVCTI